MMKLRKLGNLSHHARQINLILAEWACSGNANMRIPQRVLANQIQCSPRTVRDAVQELRLNGILVGGIYGYRLCKDYHEMYEEIDNYQKKINTMQEVVDALRREIRKRIAFQNGRLQQVEMFEERVTV